jgi:glycosyltransferase involved in cell wall biosynthesis
MTFSIVIPAFNEGQNIAALLHTLMAYLRDQHLQGDVIVVDDGSTDATAREAAAIPGIRVISHPYNKGYGAAIKTGIEAATTEWCFTYDADGQHTPELLSLLLPHCTEPNHMVVGKREGYCGPWIRQPGKRILSCVANYLTQRKIPDLNSGLRAFRRQEFLRFQHLFPNGFSLSTTSTVCYFKENLNVVYVPIRIKPRIGRSTVQMRDAPRTFLLIVRLIMLFSPLRIFLPASLFFAMLVIADVVYEMSTTGNFTNKSTVALLSLTSLTFFFGLIADQMAAIRREIGRQRN